MKKLKVGFTLAEVLITLAVIGVVASITVPTLINNINDAQYKAAWKKAYADLEQTTKVIMLNNGGNMEGFIDVNFALYFEYKKHLKILKDCGQFNFCANSSTKYAIKRLNNTLEDDYYYDEGQLVLNNGTFIAFENYDLSPIFDIIWVDVNGYTNSPNIIGKDIFGAGLYKYSLKPLGSTGDGFVNTCNATSGIRSGWGCSSKYLYE